MIQKQNSKLRQSVDNPNIANATLIIAAKAPPLKQIYIESLQHFLEAAATLKLALTLTHIPAHPAIALHTDPIQKLTDVIKAIYRELKYWLSFDQAGISLVAYMKNKPIDVMNAYLKIVPY